MNDYLLVFKSLLFLLGNAYYFIQKLWNNQLGEPSSYRLTCTWESSHYKKETSSCQNVSPDSNNEQTVKNRLQNIPHDNWPGLFKNVHVLENGKGTILKK